MKQERYNVETSDSFLEFKFFSEGPKGLVMKVVRYQEVSKIPSVFNLAFGDQFENGEISDAIVTNNGDSGKVLATVGLTIVKFFKAHPLSWIHVRGSTPSRNRLYRIKVAQNLDELREQFELRGYIDNEWRSFEKNINYDNFLIGLKY